jgi:hypothetical protein
VITFLLAALLAGISYLVKTYGIAATHPASPAILRLDHRQTLPLLVRDGLLVMQVESRVGLMKLFFLLYPRLKIRSSSYTPRRHFTLRGLHSTAGEAN